MRDLQYMIDVMTAARDGEKIQVDVGNGWENTDDPAWNWGYGPNGIDYRIAPEPRKAREWKLHEVNGHYEVCDRPCCNSDLPTIRVREVLPE